MNLNTEKVNLIGIYSSQPQMGKDEVGKIIKYLTSDFFPSRSYGRFLEKLSSDWGSPQTDWEVNKFANPLKQMIQSHFPSEFNTFEWENGGDEYRNGVMPSLNKSRRQVLQDVGMKLREVDRDYWVKALFNPYDDWVKKFSVRNGFQECYHWIVSDLRFDNEFRAIEERGGLLLKVVRDTGKTDDHESENGLENHEFHEIIENNGSLEELTEKVKAILIKYNILNFVK